MKFPSTIRRGWEIVIQQDRHLFNLKKIIKYISLLIELVTQFPLFNLFWFISKFIKIHSRESTKKKKKKQPRIESDFIA